ncbi:MAG: phage tail tube protein [Candidatus Fimivivens sp.]|nr:phage tail tube protein [Candidatus Fimivivens sp.]
MDKMKLQNIPSGTSGTGYVVLNGEVLEAFRIAKVSAQLEMTTESRRFLGEIMTQNAVRGMSGKGNLSYYHTTSALIQAMKDYQNGGSYPTITLQYNAKSPEYGNCEVVLRDVILSTVPFGALDDGSEDAIINESSLTFDDFDLVEAFVL